LRIRENGTQRGVCFVAEAIVENFRVLPCGVYLADSFYRLPA